MTSLLIVFCVVLQEGGKPPVDLEKLRVVVWQRESSGREHPPPGDGGLSIGPYQVKYARWKEYALPRERYRSMTTAQWHAWMLRALQGYLKDARGSLQSRVEHAGAQHNGSGPKARAYGRDIWRRYQQ